jgi:succinate dehydrogenase hydrophobic anchor subunit
MKKRGNYETIGKAVRLYINKIHSCLGLIIMSIHKHIVLSVLSHEYHKHYA